MANSNTTDDAVVESFMTFFLQQSPVACAASVRPWLPWGSRPAIALFLLCSQRLSHNLLIIPCEYAPVCVRRMTPHHLAAQTNAHRGQQVRPAYFLVLLWRQLRDYQVAIFAEDEVAIAVLGHE